jgi:hypothetical protein
VNTNKTLGSIRARGFLPGSTTISFSKRAELLRVSTSIVNVIMKFQSRGFQVQKHRSSYGSDCEFLHSLQTRKQRFAAVFRAMTPSGLAGGCKRFG